jgi:type II secretory pathway pseudopilin PulG
VGKCTNAQHGESLVEVVLAVAIVGIAVVGLVGALGDAFRLSSRSRTEARGDLLLTRYAEALDAAPYEACGPGLPPYAVASVAAVPSTGLPPGIAVVPWGSGDGSVSTFEVGLQSSAYWNGDTSPATFAAACGASDRGVQALVLRVRAGDGSYDRRLTIVKRSA